MTTLKKNVKDLTEYYYQWMNKHKDDADKRLKLLNEAPDSEEVVDIEEWFYFYDKWLAKVEEELGDDCNHD